MKRLKSWINNISKYPCAEIFCGTNGGKAEKRCMTICDERLYKFNSEPGKTNPLSDVKVSVRELDVILKMGIGNCRPEYFQSLVLDVLNCSKKAISALDAMHKKDPLLQAYYNEFKIDYATVEDIMKDISFAYVKKYSLGMKK